MRVAITHVAWRGPYGLDAPPLDEPLASPRARKMMSRSAYLAALALADIMRATNVSAETRTQVGYYLGVGGSAGSLDDVTALLDASIVDDQFSLPAFGDRGLAACNPLLAFQLMNNFTMCHGAILEGLGGPNGALFSRGAGTIAALAEAMHAVASGDCPLAIAGGADVATHPVTLAELRRDGFLSARVIDADARITDSRMVPADAAALVALAPSISRGDEPSDDVILEGCAHASGRDRPIGEAIEDAVLRARRVRHVRHARHATLQGPASSSTDNGFANPNAVGVADTRVAPVQHADNSADRASLVDPEDLRPDVLVVAPWGPPAADALLSFAAQFPAARVIDACANGDAIAASPALAVIAAVEALRASPGRALVLTLGIDGDPGAVLLSRGVA